MYLPRAREIVKQVGCLPCTWPYPFQFSHKSSTSNYWQRFRNEPWGQPACCPPTQTEQKQTLVISVITSCPRSSQIKLHTLRDWHPSILWSVATEEQLGSPPKNMLFFYLHFFSYCILILQNFNSGRGPHTDQRQVVKQPGTSNNSPRSKANYKSLHPYITAWAWN